MESGVLDESAVMRRFVFAGPWRPSMLPPDSNCRRALRSSFNLCHPHTCEKRLDSVSRYGC